MNLPPKAKNLYDITVLNYITEEVLYSCRQKRRHAMLSCDISDRVKKVLQRRGYTVEELDFTKYAGYNWCVKW